MNESAVLCKRWHNECAFHRSYSSLHYQLNAKHLAASASTGANKTVRAHSRQPHVAKLSTFSLYDQLKYWHAIKYNYCNTFKTCPSITCWEKVLLMPERLGIFQLFVWSSANLHFKQRTTSHAANQHSSTVLCFNNAKVRAKPTGFNPKCVELKVFSFHTQK